MEARRSAGAVDYGHVGNWAITVNSYKEIRDEDSVTTRSVIDSPTFVMGGVFGQAMTINDVKANLLRMWPKAAASNAVVNGERWISNPSDTTFYFGIHPTTL